MSYFQGCRVKLSTWSTGKLGTHSFGMVCWFQACTSMQVTPMMLQVYRFCRKTWMEPKLITRTFL